MGTEQKRKGQGAADGAPVIYSRVNPLACSKGTQHQGKRTNSHSHTGVFVTATTA